MALRGGLRGLAAALMALAALAAAAPAQQPDGADPLATPFLALETGTHLARIRTIVTGADGARAITAAPDRTIRVWDSLDGRLLRTFRLPLGPGRIGDPEAIAVSASGRSILAAAPSFDLNGTGHDYSIYLLDVESGSIRGRRQTGLDRAPLAMDLSEGNRWLALARGDLGLEILKGNLGDPARPMTDRSEGEPYLWASFTTRDRIGVLTARGRIRLYQVTQEGELTLIATAEARGGRQPHRLDFAPDGRTLAIGYLDSAAIDLFDGISLRHRATLAPPAGPGNLATVLWTAGRDGTPWLVAGGSLAGPDGRNLLVLWREGRGRPVTLAVASDSITGLAPAGPGAFVYASSDSSLGRVNLPAGREPAALALAVTPARLDFRGPAPLAVTADGAQLALTASDGTRLGFDLPALARLGPDELPAGLRSPVAEAPGLALTDWRGGTAPRLDGRPLARPDRSPLLAAGERVLSADLDPAAGRVLLGTDYHLLLTDRQGTETGRIETLLPVWGVALAQSGRVAVAALGDGTVRWYRIDAAGRLAERAALFPHADGRRWVAWRPGGAFAHSDQGGVDLVGYHLNGLRASLTGQWVTFGSIYQLYYQPARVAAALEKTKGPPPRAEPSALAPLLQRPMVAQLGYCARPSRNLDWTTRAATSPAPEAPPADAACGEVDEVVLGISRGPDGATGAVLPPGYDALDLALTIKDTGGGVSHIDAMLDGRLAGRFPLTPVQQAAATTAEGLLTSITVPLDPGQLNRVVLRVHNRAGIYRESEVLRFLTAAPEAARAPATLHLVAIGVDRYPGAGIRELEYAVKDALTVTDDIARLAAPAYDQVAAPAILTDAEATREAILELLGRVAAQARQNDAVVIYMAGHAIAEAEGYAFVTPDVPGATSAEVYRHGLTAEDLARALGNIVAGNMLLVLDTCYAGGFTVEAPDRLAHATGRYVLTATKSDQEALDHAPGTENGLFAA
ncbi:MAG TPA: hypothetical protein VFR34_12880, partial [Paracoccaceae bacterium]|nr:hypothetical protein [Paracoccaceae bacterium]